MRQLTLVSVWRVEDVMHNFERLAPDSAYSVGSLVPVGFERYARIFHPAWRLDPERRTALRWAEMAKHIGARFHPQTDWDEISAPSIRGVTVEPPDSGTLPSAVSRPLRDILSRHFKQDRCWLGVWPGFGGRAYYRKHVPPTVSVVTDTREWDLFRAPLSMMDTPFYVCSNQTANLIWCDDPGWWVTTDIDLDTTYIGGDRQLIKDVLESAALETFPMSADDKRFPISP